MRLNFSVSIAKDAYQAHVSRKKFTQKRVRTNSMRHNFRNVKTENMAIFQNLSFHSNKICSTCYNKVQLQFQNKPTNVIADDLAESIIRGNETTETHVA